MKANYIPTYAQRAIMAHAAAEAATDPRDKAAFRAAAQTWERLAKPATQTYSMAPHHLQVAALKRDVAEAVAVGEPECGFSAKGYNEDWRREAATRGAQKALERVAGAFVKPAVTIEF